ncbi:MAG: hypothetical protein H7124_01335 [Phycisphaerales bacterium]|nr:hypothetical protein [Hyphomonadaceae bacterium]
MVIAAPIISERARIARDGAGVVEIDWQIDNRFRLLSNEVAIAGSDYTEEQRFYRDLAAYTEEYREWFERERAAWLFPNVLDSDLIHPRGSRDLIQNYDTHYRAQDYRYDPAWVNDVSRHVTFSLLGPSANLLCDWSWPGRPFSNVWEACTQQSTIVSLDEPVEVKVRTRNNDTGQEAELRTGVVARDLTIVALGDSFSAGEGNPHAHWRIVSHPQAAIWLDARCHRSLISGPALAAAFLARQNPRLSVTLLHYGCSGASVADGIAGPWSFLETSAQVAARYRPYQSIPGHPGQPDDQIAPPIGEYDIAPSQIAQARADLQGRSPDAVFVSTGGNDIGFARIVTSLAAPPKATSDIELVPAGHANTQRSLPHDRAMWTSLSQPPTCIEGSSEESFVQCVYARVQARIDSILRGPESQYAVLARAIDTLGVPREEVFITQYPSLTEYRSVEGSNADYEPCVDNAFDSRPSIVPSIISWWPGMGVTLEASQGAFTEVISPLNSAVAATHDAERWTVVDGHVPWSRPYGYCSLEQRHVNTLFDSAWVQGRVYSSERRIGVVRQSTLPNDESAPHVLVWNDPSWPGGLPVGPCYLEGTSILDTSAVCSDARYEPETRDSSFLDTSGAVHPTLFGHCGYASALVTTLLREGRDSDWRASLDPAFVDSVQAGETSLQFLCSPAAWGADVVEPQ